MTSHAEEDRESAPHFKKLYLLKLLNLLVEIDTKSMETDDFHLHICRTNINRIKKMFEILHLMENFKLGLSV